MKYKTIIAAAALLLFATNAQAVQPFSTTHMGQLPEKHVILEGEQPVQPADSACYSPSSPGNYYTDSMGVDWQLLYPDGSQSAYEPLVDHPDKYLVVTELEYNWDAYDGGDPGDVLTNRWVTIALALAPAGGSSGTPIAMSSRITDDRGISAGNEHFPSGLVIAPELEICVGSLEGGTLFDGGQSGNPVVGGRLQRLRLRGYLVPR